MNQCQLLSETNTWRIGWKLIKLHYILWAVENMVAMFECKKCDYKSIPKYNQEIQKVSVHGGNKITCTTCDYQSIQKSNLKSHRELVHGGKKFTCKTCSYI